ncbi:hypothetical protein Ciccas_008513 [Cichlidogyrus casuarinus]|uniref:Uncharacterized protein n=1 Tax=Cichlidogyrus casuarinus TaxID=1844966 RepID=A0ABD2PZV3_9PLAT
MSKPYPTQPPPGAETAEQQTDSSQWPIVKACQYGALARVVQLVEHEDPTQAVDVNQLDDEGVSLLHWAAINNRRQIVMYLVSKGANVDRLGGNLVATPLQWAIRENHLDMVSLLVSHGADPTVQEKSGFNSLHVAIQCGFLNITLYLLSLGININCQTADGLTPLMVSAMFNHSPEIIRLLCKWGADPNFQDSNGNSAAHFALQHGNFTAIVQLNKNSNVNWTLRNRANLAPFDVSLIVQFDPYSTSHSLIAKL